jgi:tetratricopeptide (TPR) repeat protein
MLTTIYLYNGTFDSTTVDFDRTPERRALSDAAIAEALRLRPDLPEVPLATAFHLYACYRDYERARVQIAIAQRALPNSPDALALTAYLDRRQGRWLESTTALQKAIILDPRNPKFSVPWLITILAIAVITITDRPTID